MSDEITKIEADGWPAFDAELRHVINAAWPELFGSQHPIYRVTQIERKAWRTMVDFQKMKAPWCVIGVPPTASEPGWGACNVVYRPMVIVYYIASMGAEGSTDVASYVQNRLAVLESVLQQQDYTGFQYWPGETLYDVSENNRANAVFSGANMGLFAGSLSFRAMFGYIVKRDLFPEP